MRKLLQIRQLIGMVLVLLGVTVMIGWFARSPVVVQLLPGLVAMVFNTAFCFSLVGVTLLLARAGPAMLQPITGALVLCIAVLTGAQDVFDLNLGIDELVLKVWLTDPNPHPGRMPPMTSIGFALVGLFLLLQEGLRVRGRARVLMQLCSLAVITLGIIGITGYSLRLELLYSWYRFVRMAPHTAAGFILLGIGLWLSWYQALRLTGPSEQGAGKRITAIATIILMVMALIAGLAGFVLSSQRTEAALNNSLQAAHANRAQLLNFVIDNTIREAQSLALAPALLAKYEADLAGAPLTMDPELASHLLSSGYSSVSAVTAAGTTLLHSGADKTSVMMVLAMRDGTRLLWDEQPVLEVRMPVQLHGQVAGVLVVQRNLAVVKSLLKDAELLGKTGDIAICASLPGNAVNCLPTRLRSSGLANLNRVRDGEPLPISLALDGHTGLKFARDYRGLQVAAAYGPIGTTGLGLLVKQDTVDLYEPIRTQLHTMLAVLAVLFGSGMLLLRWQLTPLITALLRAKRDARAGEDKLQAVVDNIADGLITIDEAGVVQSINPAAASMFGYLPEEVVGHNVALLIPLRLKAQHNAGIHRYVGGGEARIVGRSGVQVPGLKKDGSEFPLQIAIREAAVEGGRIFVGIVRDITAQKIALETSSRFNAFLEATPNLVAFVGAGRELLYLNSAGRVLLGLGLDADCSAVSLAEFVCEDGAQAPIDVLFPSGAQSSWRGEFALRSRAGAVVPLMFTVVRILDPDGNTGSYALVGADVSERKRAEHDLRKTLERFNLVSRATNDTVWDWDFGTNEIWWNAGIHVTFGHAVEDIDPSADWWVAQIHPQERERVLEEFGAEIHNGGEFWTGEYRFKRADGSYAHVHDRGHIIRDDAGQAVRMIGAMMDITARKDVEERLRQLEQRFSRIFAMSPVAISVSRLSDGQVLEVNDAFAKMFGYERGELAKHTALLRNAFQTPEERMAMAERITEHSSIDNFETQLRTGDGTLISVLFSAEVVELEGEAHLLCLYNDITERKRHEHALRFSEEKFRSIVETTKDWVWTIDNDDRLVYSNPAVEQMLGYRPEELMGKPITELLHPKQRDAVKLEVKRLRALGQGWVDGHTHWLHKDGSERYLKSSALPVYDADGVMIGYRGTDHDLTAIKKFEKELREATHKAEQASHAKSEFLANMSHEIRTPMNGVIGLTRLMLKTALSDQQQEYMELIASSAGSLLRLLNDILDFSKMEAKKLALDKVEFDLREEVGNVLRAFGASAAEKELELAFDIAPEVPQLVVGDNGRLAQVLINLTSNAIKFTQRGEVVLRVVRQAHGPGVEVLHFSVADTGIGIPLQQQKHIFESFVQADASTTRKYGGSGLGLAIASQIIALMEGRLWVESEAGKGTTFHFTVRLQVPERQPESTPNRAGNELKGKRVLVADDNPTSRSIVAAILRSWDMHPVMAASAAAAVAELQRAAAIGSAYPLAVCDARMGAHGGLDFAAAIAPLRQLGPAMIVLSSARDVPGEMERYRQAGVTEFVRKPVKHSELFVAAMKVLRLDLPAAPGAHDRIGVALQGTAPRSLRVLVAEDHPINQTLVTELLRARGHFYAVANNGLEVLQMMDEHVFDAILMDGQMPEMDGYQATKEIRRREAGSDRHIHIVAVTAHAMQEDREICLAAGMDGYIAKPIEPDQLFACLELPFAAPLAAPAAGADSAVAARQGVFDLEAALRRTRGKKQLLALMARAFVEDAPAALDELRGAASDNDAVKLERAAHRLKGAAATLSGQAVADAADTLERLARAEPRLDNESMADAITQLAARIDDLSAALSQLINQEPE